MKYLNRIAIFFALLMILALTASVQAAEDIETTVASDTAESTGTKSTGKQISIDKATKITVRSYVSDLWIDSSWITLLTDEDGDGFYHHFRFSFDADTTRLSQQLYAKVFLSDGSEQWKIFESGNFWINGRSGTDVYEISTSLNEGYPPAAYDLILRLHDAVSGELLLEWGPQDDSHMADMFLEDAQRDLLYSSTPYVHSFTTELSDDFDSDGFFSRLDLLVDVDAPFEQTRVRIGVELYDVLNGWESLYLSPEIFISGINSNDREHINIELDAGFPENHYTLRLTVYESLSRAMVSSEAIQQSMPLESLDYEDSHDHHRSSSSHGSGGSMGWLMLPLLAILAVRRRFF